ncbi:serine/arginine repetitive matrix protein 1 [Amborella trichopoda]|uniref:Uncharacterized protein n=1 Tax=Amborella trichopoda TaxID=13333 RepID=W1PQZ1_AMBTC|nr:serine/arginine repetitive matrix protein 1 [Amborella trichopoda]ERN10204.1 hypothetical protein AMTR_s00171p00035960 [Amborella trichopoda]|eukprot:XP_006848623.1 serine/arginine repetitive matrix protein 1 [Amborella trichopoda]
MGSCVSKKMKNKEAEPPPPPPSFPSANTKDAFNGTNIEMKEKENENAPSQPQSRSTLQGDTKSVAKQEAKADASPPPPPQKHVDSGGDHGGRGMEAEISNTSNSKSGSKKKKKDDEEAVNSSSGGAVRSSSCAKEEVDAILIQCGRLSRSSSGKDSNPHRYCGSKRQYDYQQQQDQEEQDIDIVGIEDDEQQRHRRLNSRRSSPAPPHHRRTPSRDSVQHRRSNSGGCSAAAGRRSSPSPNPRGRAGSNNSSSSAEVGPMTSHGSMKRGGGVIKRTVGNPNELLMMTRGSGSPRSRSPSTHTNRVASVTAVDGGGQLSRNSSKRREHSPYSRRNEEECPPKTDAAKNGNRIRHREGDERLKRASQHQQSQMIEGKGMGCKPRLEERGSSKEMMMAGSQRNESNRAMRDQLLSCRLPQQQSLSDTAAKELHGEEAVPAMGFCYGKINEHGLLPLPAHNGNNNSNGNKMTRSKSSRRSSREHFPNLDHLGSNEEGDYSFPLPPSVSKACSILEAVADLNNSSSQQLNSFVESEMSHDLLTEPSLHKYVSVRETDQESAGSNTFLFSEPTNDHFKWGTGDDYSSSSVCFSSRSRTHTHSTTEDDDDDDGDEEAISAAAAEERAAALIGLRGSSLPKNLLPVITLSSKLRELKKEYDDGSDGRLKVMPPAPTTTMLSAAAVH